MQSGIDALFIIPLVTVPFINKILIEKDCCGSAICASNRPYSAVSINKTDGGKPRSKRRSAPKGENFNVNGH